MGESPERVRNMIKIENDPGKKIIESASLVIKSGPAFSKTNALRAQEKLNDEVTTTPKKLHDPSKDSKRGSELNKDMRSRRNDSEI